MEQVLVCPASTLDELGIVPGFTSDVERYLPTLLNAANLSYVPRAAAEDDPSLKQLIPYAILRCADRVFCYARSTKGSEARLHGRVSIGVGGHICAEDGQEGITAYHAGFARELAEEVYLQSGYRDSIVGIVYDPSTPVGLVHLGVVHLLELEEPKVRAIDPALSEGAFWSIYEVVAARDRLETWSQLALPVLLES